MLMPIPPISNEVPDTRLRRPEEPEIDPESCRELFCAIVGLAVKDSEHIKCLEDRPSLTAYEHKKLQQLTEDWHPADFFDGVWFEDICAMLNVQPDAIRSELLARRTVPGAQDSQPSAAIR